MVSDLDNDAGDADGSFRVDCLEGIVGGDGENDDSFLRRWTGCRYGVISQSKFLLKEEG